MAVDFRLRDFMLPGPILRLRRTLARSQWMADPQRLEQQSRYLRRVVRQAAHRVPHYRAHFAALGLRPHQIRSPADLRVLPTLQRRDLRQPAALRATDVWRYGPRPCISSGSTGQPIRFLQSSASQALEFNYYWRWWGWAGYHLGDPFVDLNTTWFLPPGRQDHLYHWQPHLRRLLINASRLEARHGAAIAHLLRSLRPRFLKGLPSALYLLARTLAGTQGDRPRFQALFALGEPLVPSLRQGIESAFCAPLLDSYGLMERVVAISQCPHGRYHVHDDYGLLQWTDRHDQDDATFNARVIGTGLHNLAMPLIRYDTGDRVRFWKRPPTCPCGRTLPVVHSILGRSPQVVVSPSGRVLPSLSLLSTQLSGLHQLQFIQEERHHLRVLVVPDPNAGAATLRGRVTALVGRVVGPDLRTDVELVGPTALLRDRSGKVQPVVSRLDEGRLGGN